MLKAIQDRIEVIKLEQAKLSDNVTAINDQRVKLQIVLDELERIIGVKSRTVDEAQLDGSRTIRQNISDFLLNSGDVSSATIVTEFQCYDCPAAKIRGTLGNMKRAGQIRKVGNKWRLAK